MTTTLSHIQLNTPKLEEQVQFYEKYFAFRRKAHGKGWFLWNQTGFLMAVNPLPERPDMPSWFHIGFRYDTVDEVKALYERLKSFGSRSQTFGESWHVDHKNAEREDAPQVHDELRGD